MVIGGAAKEQGDSDREIQQAYHLTHSQQLDEVILGDISRP